VALRPEGLRAGFESCGGSLFSTLDGLAVIPGLAFGALRQHDLPGFAWRGIMPGLLESWLERFRRWRGLAGGQPAAEPASAGAAAPAAAEAPKQAVIIVHGMGEQRPMDTLKGFVQSVWELDPVISANGLPNPNMVWSKPDDRTGSLELRRITTRESIASPAWPDRVRTDFYELYWADLTAGSTWGQFTSWVRHLLVRPWARVPTDVRSAWLFLWFATIVIALVAMIGLLPKEFWAWIKPYWPGIVWIASWQWLLIALAAVAGPVLHKFASATFGRVVRYTRADPDNIAARAAVRERGLALLRSLHRGDDYSRIVLVAHSLGTMLAYDLLSYYWAERSAARTIDRADPDDFAALCAVETEAAKLEAATPAERPAARDAYRAAQARLRRRLAARPVTDAQDHGRWLISDFVTMGCPLTHAEFLIASSQKDLDDRIRARELPSAPPYRESLDPDVLEKAKATKALPIAKPETDSRLISFPNPKAPTHWIMHHAAPFAAVRWTNIYDPARFVFFGDVIGGPLADTLGKGIRDVDLRALRGQSRTFSHTAYWRPDRPAVQLEAVRRAVDLLDL
jgi:hypothetical protein